MIDHSTYKQRRDEILHNFGVTYSVLTKEERLKDIDEAAKALDELFLEVVETPLAVEYDDPLGAFKVIQRFRASIRQVITGTKK